jgi:peptidyl-prolyl cis-trans isomerase B (cyclophilin B)
MRNVADSSRLRVRAAAVVILAAAPVVGCHGPGAAPSAPANANAAKPPALTAPDKNQLGVLETTAGKIVVEFYPDVAPKHTLAFQNMFRSGFFDGTVFHRVIPKQAIQGGDPNSKDDDPSDDGLGQPGQATIPAEFSTEIKHTRGIVSAARKGDNKDSATSQFFICLGNEPAYDGNYTIFGRVIEGMNVVGLISDAPVGTAANREKPVEAVAITRAYLTSRSALGLKPAETK